jgi:hypothetical protein
MLNFSSEISSLNNAKTFFESLQSFNTPGKMKNLTISTGEIDKYQTIPDILNILDILLAFAQKNSPHIAWIKQAVSVLQPASPWVNKAESVQKEIKEALLAISPVTGASIKSFTVDTIQRIGNLKSEYIKDYAAWHSAVRLNANDEKKKTKLLKDERFITLEYLTQINILPVRQVQEFKKTLNDFVSCTNLTIDELQNTPVCPHCNYIPQRDGITGGVSARIEEADDVLEKMVTDWTAVLVNNLNDSWVKENMNLLKSSDRVLLDSFIKSGKLPSPINDDFIIALKEALSRLDKVSITVEDIRKVLQRSGGPAKPGELKDRFNNYIDSLTQGKEAAKVRIVVE